MGRQRTIEMGSAIPLDALSLRKSELKDPNRESKSSELVDPLLNEASLPARLRGNHGWRGRRQNGWFRS